MTSDPTDAPMLDLLPHPDDESVLAAARDALLTGMCNVFIVGEEEFHIDACFLALYHQLKLEPGLQLHRMMSPKVDDIVELFNTVLADLSIEEARNQQAHERHIIVMPDFGPNAGKEWMACESLVNTFPGSNVGMLAFSTIDIMTLRRFSSYRSSRVINSFASPRWVERQWSATLMSATRTVLSGRCCLR